MSRPTELRQPVVGPARTCLKEARSAIGKLVPGPELDRLLDRARRAVLRAEGAGASQRQVESLREQLRSLERRANEELGRLVRGPAVTSASTTPPPTPREVSSKWSESAAKRGAVTVKAALSRKDHWRHEETKAQLMRVVMGNEAIDPEQEEQLSKDIVEVLNVTPDALGLVKEATIRGQRNALATPGKLGKGSGSAYEIMGAAQLMRTASTASNTGATLNITAGQDRVDFGLKLPARAFDPEGKMIQSRRTIEADILIFKPDHREVAVDFKYVKNAGGYSDKGGREATRRGESDLAKQLAGVANSLRLGAVDEFHFATNGHFTPGFNEAVETANATLRSEGHPLISLHEHVVAESLR